MKKKSILWVAACFLIAVTMISCGEKKQDKNDGKGTVADSVVKSDDQMDQNNQLDPLDQDYNIDDESFEMSDDQQNQDYKRTENGLYYKEIVKGTGKKLKMDDVVRLRLAYYINDSLLFTTDNYPQEPYDVVRESIFKGDLYEGLSLMHEGDSMSFLIKADSTFIKQFGVYQLPNFITPDAYLRWEVKVEESMTMDEYQQRMENMEEAKQQAANDEFEAYLKKHNIKGTRTQSGLVYVCTKKGNGVRPEAHQKVKVHYTGTLLDGTEFDSSIKRGTPIDFELGEGRVIPGWDEGIALMSKGEKGVLYIPSYLGYGSRQVSAEIIPYSNLVFEVELVDFE